MGFTVGMVIDHFETFWNTSGQRSCHLPKPTLVFILHKLSNLTREMLKINMENISD